MTTESGSMEKRLIFCDRACGYFCEENLTTGAPLLYHYLQSLLTRKFGVARVVQAKQCEVLHSP